MAWSNATAACDWTPVAVSCREPFCIPHYSQLLLRKLLSFSSVAAKTPFNKHPVFTEHNEATNPELVSWLITKSRLIWKVIPTDDFYDGDGGSGGCVFLKPRTTTPSRFHSIIKPANKWMTPPTAVSHPLMCVHYRMHGRRSEQLHLIAACMRSPIIASVDTFHYRQRQ